MPRHARRRRRPSDWLNTQVRVGEVYMDRSQVRAELDRTDGRALSLKRDIASHLPANHELRESFGDWYNRWHRFYVDAYDDWLAWGSNVTQSQAFGDELDAFRARYAEASGREASNPTTARTVRRTSWGGFGRGLGMLGVGLLAIGGAVGIAYLGRD